MASLIKKIPASSLLEVIVSMTLLAISLSIGFMILMNVARSNYSSQQIKASLRARIIVRQTIVDKLYVDEHYESESITYEKRIQAYKSKKNLLCITVTAHTKDKKLLVTHNQIFRTNANR